MSAPGCREQHGYDDDGPWDGSVGARAIATAAVADGEPGEQPCPPRGPGGPSGPNGPVSSAGRETLALPGRRH